MHLLRLLLLAVLSVAASASAQPRRTLARVVSVQGKTVTIEALEGYLTVGDEVELWTESGKRLSKVTLPVDLVNRGDRVAGVGLSGATPPAGALLSQKSQFTSWAQAAAALAAFPPKALARIVAVEGDTVTVRVLVGSIVNGDELDVLSAGGRTSAKVKTPTGIDLILTGDTVKGVSLSGAKASTGALLADTGRFLTLEAAASAAGATPAPTVPAAPSGPRESAAACVFTNAELRQALGFSVGAGRGTELAFGTGSTQSCTWGEEKGLRSVVLNRTVMTAGEPATNREQLRRRLAGRLEPVAGDPDFAAWQVDQGDVTGVTLHYARGNTFTEVRVSGVEMKKPASVSAMRKAVLKLRRL